MRVTRRSVKGSSLINSAVPNQSDRDWKNQSIILRKGDQVIVWKLDRLGRSLRDLVDLINYFEEKEVGFTSIEDRIDAATPVGQFTFHVFAAVAQFERDIIRVRTLAGFGSGKST